MAAPQNNCPTDPALNSSALRISREDSPFQRAPQNTWGPQASAKLERTLQGPKLQLGVIPLPAGKPPSTSPTCVEFFHL